MSGEAKSASAEDEPPAMAAIDESTWQSPNIVLHAFSLAFLKSSPARPTDRPRRSKLKRLVAAAADSPSCLTLRWSKTKVRRTERVLRHGRGGR
jgi:hypothetical protein